MTLTKSYGPMSGPIDFEVPDCAECHGEGTLEVSVKGFPTIWFECVCAECEGSGIAPEYVPEPGDYQEAA